MFKVKFSYTQNRVNISNCELNLSPGLYQLCGPNGSGKTTILNILSHKIDCPSLEMIYNQTNLVEIDQSELLKQYITYVPQVDYLFEHLSAIENIEILATGYDDLKLSDYAKQLNMTDVIDKRLKCCKLSGGERRKLSFIIGLLKNTPILFLDEVDNYVDTNSKHQMLDILKNEDRITIIISHEQLNITNKIVMAENIKYISQSVGETDYPLRSWTNTFNLKQSKKYITISSIPFVLIIILILGIYQSLSLVDSASSAFREPEYPFVSKTDMIVYPPQLNTYFDFYQTDEWLSKTPTLFTEEDFQKLNNLDGVEKVIPLDDPEMGYNCYFEDDKCYFASDEEDAEVLGVPKEVISNINNTTFTLINGVFPEDNSKQVLISSEYANEKKLTVGDTFTLNLESETGQTDKTFTVSGIFTNESYYTPILYAYSDSVITHRPASEFDYFSGFNANGKFNEKQLAEYFQKSSAHYYGFYVKTDSESSLNEVSKQINDYDMYIENISVVAGQFNFLNKVMQIKVRKILEVSAVFLIVMILMITWSLWIKYKQLNKSVITVLQHYGYSDEEVKIIVNNNTTKYIKILIVTILTVWISMQQFTDSYKWINGLVTLSFVILIKIIELIISRKYEH